MTPFGTVIPREYREGATSLILSLDNGPDPLFQAAANFRGRVKILADVGSDLSCLQRVSRISVIDGFSLTYHGDDCVSFFETAAKETSKPLFIQSRRLTCEDVRRLRLIPNISALVDTRHDLEEIARFVDAADLSLAVYTSEPRLFLPALSVGASGLVPPETCTRSGELERIARLFKEGDTLGASVLHRRYLTNQKTLL